MMSRISLTVGELATTTGVSVRTLHYYDEINLLKPSQRTDSGRRIYAEDDVLRLQQIVSLRELNLSLEQIRKLLDDAGTSAEQVIQLHLDKLEKHIEQQRKLYRTLEGTLEHLQGAEEISVETIIQTIKEITMYQKYYTPEQLEELKQRKEQVGEERIQEVQQEWKELMDRVKQEMDKGTDPASEAMQELAGRWQGLIDEFTGGNKEIEKSLGNLYKHEGPAVGRQHGFDFDPKMFEYVGKAMVSLHGSK